MKEYTIVCFSNRTGVHNFSMTAENMAEALATWLALHPIDAVYADSLTVYAH